jgi:hypothetical protein
VKEELVLRELHLLLGGVNDALGAFLNGGLELIVWLGTNSHIVFG